MSYGNHVTKSMCMILCDRRSLSLHDNHSVRTFNNYLTYPFRNACVLPGECQSRSQPARSSACPWRWRRWSCSALSSSSTLCRERWTQTEHSAPAQHRVMFCVYKQSSDKRAASQVPPWTRQLWQTLELFVKQKPLRTAEHVIQARPHTASHHPPFNSGKRKP